MRGQSERVFWDVVLVGAGHAHVEVLRSFGMQPMPGVRLTLITREVDTPYSGMLPGVVAGCYEADEAQIDTGPLTRFAGARLYQDRMVGLDLAGRRVVCADRPPVRYDLLSLDIGATPNTRAVPGAGEHTIPVKPIDGFLARFDALLERVRARRGRARIVLVGGGAGGIELMLSVERRLRCAMGAAQLPGEGLAFVLVSGAPHILPGYPEPFRRRAERILRERGVEVVTGARVARVEPGRLIFDSEGPIAADEILWLTEAAPAPWLTNTGLALDERGFVRVDACLRAIGQERIFAAGDIASFEPRALPKAGVYAVRAGPVLAENLRRSLTGRALKAFRPQRQVLTLLSTGERHAIGTRNGLVVAGDWVWRWKDWIDRRFMRRYVELPFMEEPVQAPALEHVAEKWHRFSAKTDDKTTTWSRSGDSQRAGQTVAGLAEGRASSAVGMRCGGCGAKVGAGVLTRALHGLDLVRRPDVLVGLEAPDDAAVVDTGGPRLSVHTVDYFPAMVDDPYRFGIIAANHALGDLFAMGAEPQTALAIAALPFGPEAIVEGDLAALMAGAGVALANAGCALVGGHTSEGAELALGFAVNGLVSRDAILRKGRMQPGDRLILTKAIGTGTLFAAHGRGRAKARWIMGALDRMSRSNRLAADILVRHQVRAATDVTGFGLAGHLIEMADASEVSATLWLDRVPVLPGARETLSEGIVSSLQPQNESLAASVFVSEDHPGMPLLFDPQTAGGILAAVPADAAETCLRDLREAGYQEAAIVGRVMLRQAQAVVVVAGAEHGPALTLEPA